MKWNETVELVDEIRMELGIPKEKVSLVPETNAEQMFGDRLGSKPVMIKTSQEKDIAVIVKYRDRSAKLVARSIYRALAKVLWPTLPYWKYDWYGIVMAQPLDMPKGVKVPDGAQPRSKLLALSITQAKRFYNGTGK